MDNSRIYIKSATQISMQEPLSESWMTSPVVYQEPYVRCIDPNFREWLNPLESRRMGKILKRALVTAMSAIKTSGIQQPGAIITGTGLGCIEHTEQFLRQLCQEGEELLKPTSFMQSTHNTISSLIAIRTQCHGYNSTYSHKSVSFDSALMDAFIQMRLGDIDSALVTGNDELTPTYFEVLRRTGYIGQSGQVPAGEASVAMMLSTNPDQALCEIESLHMTCSPDKAPASLGQIDAVMVGTNGCTVNDEIYDRLTAHYASVPLLHYKHLFGEGYSASALGLYAAAHVLKTGEAPALMRCDGEEGSISVRRLLVVNHSDGTNFTYTVMRKVE